MCVTKKLALALFSGLWLTIAVAAGAAIAPAQERAMAPMTQLGPQPGSVNNANPDQRTVRK